MRAAREAKSSVSHVPISTRLRLKAIQARDRWRLRRLAARHPGLEVHPSASSNFAVARYALAPGARLRIGPGAVTDRVPGALLFSLEAGAEIEIGEGAWLRTEVEPLRIVAAAGARITIGADALLNGCHLSAKREITLGRRVWIGFGSRILDSDQHDLDAQRRERAQPVHVGDYTWIAADVTVLRGVRIGAHCVIGARSLVTRDLPDHALAFGHPAQPRGVVGDRSRAR
jgi:acetyltransferase-like isoleucine patch superfamily enzyme